MSRIGLQLRSKRECAARPAEAFYLTMERLETQIVAIAQNSQNKAGALVAINELLSPEIQASRYDQLKILPVLDNDKLSDEERRSLTR